MIEREILEPQMQPSLDEFKAHIRVTSNDLDMDLESKLRAAIENSEKFIGQVIAPSVFTQNVRFSQTVTLRPPVIGVESVEVDGQPVAGFILRDGKVVLPADASGERVTVTYCSGMVSVPYDIRAAVLLVAASLFNNPVDRVETLPKASSRLLRPYRHWGLNDGE